MTRYSGVVSSVDIVRFDAMVSAFIAREGYIRNIFDFYAIEGMTIPRSRLFERGKRSRRNPGHDRGYVVPHEEIRELFGDYAQAQMNIGNGKLIIVETLDEAFALLRLREPGF